MKKLKLKKKDPNPKESKNARVAIYVVTFIVCIIGDIQLSAPIPSLSTMIPVLYSAIVTISGIWVTCYLLFLQLYKDKYPIEIIKENYAKKIKATFSDVIYALLLGVCALFFEGTLTSIWFCIVCVCTIIQVLYYVYTSNKSLMTETHVTDYCDKICRDLEEANNTISDTALRKIENILDECILKNEYRTVSIIVKRTSKIYKSFLENAVKIANDEQSIDLDSAFERIVELNLYELKCCSHIKSEAVVNAIIGQQYRNLKYCIDNRLYEYYKIYLQEYCRYVYMMQTDGNDVLVDLFYTVFANTYTDLLDHHDREEYITFLIESVESLVSSLVFSNKNSNTKGYFKYLTTVIVESLEKDNRYSFNIMLDKVENFSRIVLRHKNAFENLKVYYTILFHKIVEKDPGMALVYFERLYSSSTVSANDPSFIEFELMSIDQLYNCTEDNNSKEKLLKIHIDVIQKIVKLKSEYMGTLLLPDFKKIIIECQYALKEKMNDRIDLAKKLLNSCILHDNVAAFYIILDKLVDVFAETEQRQKDLQEQLFNIYFWLIRRCSSAINEQFQEITFSALRETVERMDKNRSVSKAMAKYILGGLHKAIDADIMSGQKMVSKIIDFFFSLLEESGQISFITNHNENKRFAYKALFNIGTDCIENNFELGIRKVSNSLGWLTIFCLKNREYENAKYIIERSLELFNISKKMLVSEKTLTFILTLFTTVGTFCCKDPGYFQVRKVIVAGIKQEQFCKIETAIHLRTSENDSWNELFENRTSELTTMFIDEIKRVQS